MYFLAGPLIPGVQESALITPFDETLRGSIYWIGMSKFFSIFSILFGLSFYIQQQSARRQHSPFAGRFTWKMALLAGFGFIHWGFFPGDILTMYAIIGVLLIPLSKLSNRSLLALAILLQLGLGRVIYFAITGGELLFAFNWFEVYSSFINAVLKGNILDVMSTSYPRYVQFWNEQLGLWGRFYSSLSYFILGLLLGRCGWLEDLPRHIAKFKVTLMIGLPSALVFLLLHIKYIGGAWSLWSDSLTTWSAVMRFEIYDLFALSLTLTYASAFVLFAHKFSASKLVRYLGSYGRTGLTTYLFQSLLGTFIYFNWGLGLIDVVSISQTLIVFVVLLVIQISFSHLWLKRYQYGPLEWLWRSLTFFKWVAIKADKRA